MGLLGTTTQASYYTGSDFGTYQFVNLDSIINNFMYVYVGENKIINKVNRTDVQFHAMRALQELSYDVLRSFKSQEIEVPNTLTMVLPQDYVNYRKIARIGSDGLERPLYPTRHTSNPFAITQTTDGTYSLSTARRKVRITVPSSNDITDGDYVNLLYTSVFASGSSSGSEAVRNVFFVFDKNNSTDGGPPISISATSTKTTYFYIGLLAIDTMTSNVVADKLVAEINSFGHHTATNVGSGVVEIEYIDGTVFEGSTANTGSSEGAYANNVDLGGANSTNITVAILQNGFGSSESLLEQTPSDTLSSFQDVTPVDYQLYDINYSSDIEISTEGRRYGLEPEHAQINGSFYIDNLRGKIHFGAALSGETIVLHYVSDGVGTDSEMVIHKFCEEACYKHIMYGVLSGRSNIPEYIVQRFKKEKFAETRKAKIRLSNIKIEEFTQIVKGMGKQIK
jgi:hypothetical protein